MIMLMSDTDADNVVLDDDEYDDEYDDVDDDNNSSNNRASASKHT